MRKSKIPHIFSKVIFSLISCQSWHVLSPTKWINANCQINCHSLIFPEISTLFPVVVSGDYVKDMASFLFPSLVRSVSLFLSQSVLNLVQYEAQLTTGCSWLACVASLFREIALQPIWASDTLIKQRGSPLHPRTVKQKYFTLIGITSIFWHFH